MSISNKVQLITYADSLGKNLQDLNFVLQEYFTGVINGVHILPFYPSNVDRGFGPLTHLEVDPKFGTWENIEQICHNFEVMADLVVNHISDESVYFQDFLHNGFQSQYADMFLTMNKFFPDGSINQQEMEKVYVRKPVLPVREVYLESGEKVNLWNTFFKQQIDIDINSPVTKELLKLFIENLAKNGVKMLRLDALGYTTKKIGTRCFFEEPEIYEIMSWMQNIATPLDITLLPEIHLDYETNQKLSEHGFYTYDFALPFLVLHALFSHDLTYLKNWLEIRSPKQFTVLDTHDGIGIVDVKDLLPGKEIENTRHEIYKNGGNDTLYASGLKAENLDVYQINCTYYSALGCNDKAYLAARAIQLFTPGIPQIYYVGLLAGENDVNLMSISNHGRDINRHYYTLDEIEKSLEKKVVKNLFALIKFRNHYGAFNGDFEFTGVSKDQLIMKWTKNDLSTELTVNLTNYTLSVKYFNPESEEQKDLVFE